MTQLYKISERFCDLVEIINSDDQTISSEYLITKLNSIEGEFKSKAESITKMILNLESDSAQLESEELRLKQKRLIIERKTEWLRNYLLKQMDNTGIRTIVFDYLKVFISQNPPSVLIINELAIPPEYKRTIPERHEVDKIKILKNFKENGEILPGIEIVKNMRLEIK